MTLDTPDALLFDQTIGLASPQTSVHLGDTDPVDLRRARAVGILADPQYALDLLSRVREKGRNPPRVLVR